MLEAGNSYSCYPTHRGCHMVLVLDVVQAKKDYVKILTVNA
jgi:hypothetical protein